MAAAVVVVAGANLGQAGAVAGSPPLPLFVQVSAGQAGLPTAFPRVDLNHR